MKKSVNMKIDESISEEYVTEYALELKITKGDVQIKYEPDPNDSPEVHEQGRKEYRYLTDRYVQTKKEKVRKVTGRGTIAAVINDAVHISGITENIDWELARDVLAKMADSSSRPYPLSGSMNKDGDFPYKNGDADAVLSKDALRLRIYRILEKNRT